MRHECGCERGDDCTTTTMCALQSAVEELEAQLDAYKERMQLIAAQSIRDCEKVEQLEAQLRNIKLMAKPVAATAKNTSAVRTGHELGGYIKHYIVPTHLITAILEEKSDET